MKVKTIVETDDGAFEFSAELSPQQHAFLLEYAIRDLIRKGLMPFVTPETEAELASIAPNVDSNIVN